MTKKIFKAIDPLFVKSYLAEKKNYFFPEYKKEKIKNIKIEQISPLWAKKTCLVRYRIIFENNFEKVIRGTAKTDSSKKNIWKIMNYLYGNLSEKEGLAIPRPLDYLEDINLILYQEAVGTPLALILAGKNQKKKINSLKKAAAWLSWLHKLSPKKQNLPRAIFIKSGGYKKTLTEIEKNIPQLKKYLQPKDETAFFDKLWDFEKTIIHNDFYPGNLIVGKNIFFAIDFDRTGFGPPLMDVAALFSFFIFSKKMWPQKLTERESQKLKHVFLEEYCLINGLSLEKTKREIHPFLIKSFFDQLHYYTSFFLEGRRFMNEKMKQHFTAIIKNILIEIRKLKNEQ